MRLKLAHKLILINAAIILALTIAFVGLSYSFSKSMYSNALNGIDLEVMESLSATLSENYQKNRSWDEYIQNRARWNATADHAFFSVFFTLMAKVAGEPGPGNAAADRFPPPAPSAEMPKWEFPFGTFLQRLSLLDPDKNPLIEPEIFNVDASYQKIKLDGEIIGWLRVGKINVDMLPLAQYFFEQQLTIVYAASIFGGVVAVILSILLSRHITAPIKDLTVGAQQIAKRNFKNVIRIKTGDELQELSESFNSISQELDLHQTRQKQWLLDVSHELRAPLTLLVGEVFAICDNLTKCDDATANYLQSQVMHIKRIADDLYQLCQMDELGLRFNRQPLILQPLVAQQVQQYLEYFRQKNILVNGNYSSEPIAVLADGDRLMQVLSNLFENCLRYMNSPGELWIRIEHRGENVLVEVEDSGPGVPAAELPQLFDRLYSANKSEIGGTPSRYLGGAGLGLSICREIVLAHDGSIEARLGERGGLCIRVTLPLLREVV